MIVTVLGVATPYIEKIGLAVNRVSPVVSVTFDSDKRWRTVRCLWQVLVERTPTGVEPGVVRPDLAMRLFHGYPLRADSVEIGGVGVGVESPAVSVELVRARDASYR